MQNYLKGLLILILIIVKGEVIAQQGGHYAKVNGLNMYYEIHGTGKPLVLIHGGGSTIQTSFAMVLPIFAKTHQVIAVELQAHGHTADIDRPLTFQQDADDVAALLAQLSIKDADILGFSNGGSTALQVGIRHPQQVHKLVAVSAAYKRDGFYPWFWGFMKNAKLENMPAPLKKVYLQVAPRLQDLQIMHDKDANRMINFKDWTDNDIRSITAPTFVISSDGDVIMPEHTLAMYRLLKHGQLSILPGKHGYCIGEITTGAEKSDMPLHFAAMVEEFLNAPMPESK